MQITKMKTVNLPKNVLSIQKCLIPDCDFLKKNYGHFCIIPIPGTFSGIIVRIGLCDPTNITGCCFIDSSVFVFQTSDRSRALNSLISDVDFQTFRVLPRVSKSKLLNVRVVFSDIYSLKYQNEPERLTRFLRELLKLYVFSRNSVILLDNLSKQQKGGIYCIHITEIDGNSHESKVNIYSCVEQTLITISECLTRNKYESSYCSSETIKLGGLSKSYDILKEVIDYSKREKTMQGIKICNKILLTGPSGCGKTSLVHNVVRDCKAVLVEVLFSEISSPLPGENEKRLQVLFDKAKAYADNGENCVILIEDIDVICGEKRSHSSDLVRIVNKLISLLEDVDNCWGIVVIGITSDLDHVDPQLRRAKRFDEELEILIPTEGDREEIISNILEYFKVKCPHEVVRNFALWTPGFVGADLQLAIYECISLYQKTKVKLLQANDNILHM